MKSIKLIYIIRTILCTKQIDFLKDLNKKILINQNKESRKYFKFEIFNVNEITNFINILNPLEIFLITPIISTSNSMKDPYVYLSPQFLIC
jgi:hypothetical protein